MKSETCHVYHFLCRFCFVSFIAAIKTFTKNILSSNRSLSRMIHCECQICLLYSAFLSFRILCDKTGLVINARRVGCKQIFCMGNCNRQALRDKLHSLHFVLCCVSFVMTKLKTIEPYQRFFFSSLSCLTF